MCSSDLSRSHKLWHINMTTPAISISNQTLAGGNISVRHYHQCGGTNIFDPPTGVVNLRKSETRPASSNHPRNRSGWRNPGAWNHSRSIDNPNPDGTLRMYSVLPSPGCTQGEYVEYSHGGQWTLSGSSLPAFPSALEGRAVSRALLKLKHQQVNLAVAFAERKQTIDMFKNRAAKIAHQVRTYKGKRPKDWAQVILGNRRSTPNSWLELQYGWKPLISDITGACIALSDLQNGNNPYLARVKGYASQKTVSTWQKSSNYSPAYRFTVTDKVNHFCKVSLYYQLRNPTLAAFSSLGLTNPFELAWEKMKYSFVVDWFLPVGNWLSTLDADFGWDFRSGTKTDMSTLSASSRFTNSGFAPGQVAVSFSGTAYKCEAFNMVRTLYGAAPWGGIPRFKNPLSGLHVGNAVALLAQSFRKFKVDTSKYTE